MTLDVVLSSMFIEFAWVDAPLVPVQTCLSVVDGHVEQVFDLLNHGVAHLFELVFHSFFGDLLDSLNIHFVGQQTRGETDVVRRFCSDQSR